MSTMITSTQCVVLTSSDVTVAPTVVLLSVARGGSSVKLLLVRSAHRPALPSVISLARSVWLLMAPASSILCAVRSVHS